MIKQIKIVVIASAGLVLGGISMAQRGAVTGVTGVSLPGVSATTTGAASDVLIVKTIQNAINRVLSFLAFIALILLLYAGFMMLTAAGDEERYGNGFKILKQVALGLAFIGLAWIMVSMIFRLIAKIT